MKLEYIEFEAGDARRKSPVAPKEIDTNINITSASATKKDRLIIQFTYIAYYRPDGSHIRLRGNASFKGEHAKKLYQEYAKTKTITGDTGSLVLNSINYHSAVNAVLIAKSFGLTPPIILPTLSFGKPKAKKSKPKKSPKKKKSKKR